MKFLEECGFLEEDIKEYEGNTPELVRKTIDEHEALVKTNIDFLKNLGIKTYKEISSGGAGSDAGAYQRRADEEADAAKPCVCLRFRTGKFS